jgi:hypothetical protein
MLFWGTSYQDSYYKDILAGGRALGYIDYQTILEKKKTTFDI